MKKIMIVLAVLVAVTALTGIQAASASEMQPAEVVEAIYAAVEAGDVDAAVEMLAEDAVFILAPLPEWMDGPFVGKEEIGAWYEGLVAENGRFEFSNVESNGNMATMRLAYYDDHFDKVLGGPAEFDSVAVVQDGLLKSITFVDTPAFTAKMAAADRLEENEALVRRILQEIWSEGNLELVDELIAEDYVSHTWPIVEGRDEYKADVAGWRTHFPGATIVVDKVVFDENKAIIFSHTVGPDGSLDEPPPEDYIEDILIYQIEDGQLSDRWYFAPFDPTE